METSETKKVTKQTGKKSATSAIRVSQETRKRLVAELGKINKKAHGKRVKVDALIARLLSKISDKDLAELQEASLSGRDRLEQNYRAYCAKFGAISMDRFLSLISQQPLPQMSKGEVAKTTSQDAANSDVKIGS